MNNSELNQLLSNYVIPLFGGSYVDGDESSTSSQKCVASSGSSLLIKLNKDDGRRIKLSRPQPFKKEDRELIRLIVDEFSKIQELSIDAIYKDSLYITALENAISMNLSSEGNIIRQIIQKCSEWSERTYEGGRVSFGFVVDFDLIEQDDDAYSIEEVLDKDFSAVLSDGVSSWLVLDKGGKVIEHKVTNPIVNDNLLTPNRFLGISEFTSGNKVGIVLLSNGEILLIKDNELKFAKRRGSWRSFHHKETITQMKGKSYWIPDDDMIPIYLTALDVSFGRSGGCICFTRKSNEQNLYKKNVINEHDLLSKSLSCKSSTLKKIVNSRKLSDLPRKLRQEILGMDGATILNNEGLIIASGAIITIKESDNNSGGRTAAAKALSNYGISIKVSEDGMIIGYNKGEKLFSIG